MTPCVPARRTGAETGKLGGGQRRGDVRPGGRRLILRRRDVEHQLVLAEQLQTGFACADAQLRDPARSGPAVPTA